MKVYNFTVKYFWVTEIRKRKDRHENICTHILSDFPIKEKNYKGGREHKKIA